MSAAGVRPGPSLAVAASTGLRRSRPAHGLFVLPFVVLYLAMVIWPAIHGIWISLHDHDLLSDTASWVGLDNYANLWADDVFHQVLWNTVRFVLISVPMFVGIALALALALNRPGRVGALLRGTFFCASVLSVTIVTLVWRLALMPERGLVSQALAAIGLPDVALLSHPTWALPSVAVVTVWWIIGLPMMLFLSALQQIPAELYEAAALDNASRWRTFTRITLPSLRRTLVLVVVIEVIRQFQVFAQVQLLTGGGPSNTTRPIVQFIYEQGFVQLSLGYATAASQVLFVIMMLGVSLQLWLERDRRAAR